MTYDRLSPVEGGFATLQQHTTDEQWKLLFPRLEILAQEKAILATANDQDEARRAVSNMTNMIALIVPAFGGLIPEIVHQMIEARSAQIVAEKNAADAR